MGRRLVTLLPLALAVAVVSVPPASADPATGTVSAPNGVLFPGCQQVPVSYSLSLDTGTTTWTLTLELDKPDGGPESYVDIGTQENSPTSGTVSMSLCGGDAQPGRFSVQGNGGEDAVGPTDNFFTVAPSSFEMAPVPTRISLTSRRTHSHYTVMVKLDAQKQSGGYGPYPHGGFVFQRLVGGRWKTVPHSEAEVGRHGKVKIPAAVPRTTKYRAYCAAYDLYGASTSNVITLRKH